MEVLVSAEDDAEVRRVSITQFRQPRAGDRGHLLCRARAGAPGRSTSRIRPFPSCSSRPSISPMSAPSWRPAGDACADGARDLGGASRRRRRRGGRQARDRDRPGPLPRPRPRRPNADRGDRRPAALEHGRHRARSDLRAAPPRAGRARRDRAHRLLDDGRVDSRRRCSTSSTSIATPPPSSGRPRWPGPRRRCSCITSASIRARRRCSSVSPATCSMPRRRCAPSSDTIRRGGGGQPGLWAQGISGDLPIVLLRIADTENLDIARQLLQAHEYWRMKQLAVDLVHPERARILLCPGPSDRARDAGAHEPVAIAGRRGVGRRAVSSCCGPI